MFDVGVSALAFRALLHSRLPDPAVQTARALARAASWLLARQDADDGQLGAGAAVRRFDPITGKPYLLIEMPAKANYSHAMATLALAEASSRWNSVAMRDAAQHGLEFIERSRNPYLAWRYAYPPDGDNDVSVTGWMLQALGAGAAAGLAIDDSALRDGLGFLDQMTDPSNYRTGYHEKGSLSGRQPDDVDKWPSDQSEAMTAMALIARQIGGRRPATDPMINGGLQLPMAKLPVWDEAAGSVDFCYWHLGTRALQSIGGRSAESWRRSLENAVVSHQRSSGCERGSWDPQVDPWGDDGGRVYATALNALTLEIAAGWIDLPVVPAAASPPAAEKKPR